MTDRLPEGEGGPADVVNPNVPEPSQRGPLDDRPEEREPEVSAEEDAELERELRRDGGADREKALNARVWFEERPEERDSLALIEERLLYAIHATDSDIEEGEAALRTLINEVRELREENAGLERTIGQDREEWAKAESRIKQMEEALRDRRRERLEELKAYGLTLQEAWASVIESQSDTEEEA